MPEDQPLFSVIIPAYNREKLVGAALCSVAGQTFADWECIVVDDGSTDGTRVSVRMIHGILAGLAKKENKPEPRICLIERPNGGPGAARNAGAALAKGKYLAFLDSDDMWRPWTLETYRDALEKAGWPEYLAAPIRCFTAEDEPPKWVRDPLRMEVFQDAVFACAHGHVVAGVPMTVVSTEAFRRTGGFLEDRLNAEDHDLTLRLGDCRGFVAVREPVTVAYRQHGAQETSSQAKGIAGMLRLVAREHAGMYPGGVARAGERRRIIATHARPACLAALKTGEFRLAWRLYGATFGWQLATGRWRFLAGFPLLSLKQACTLSA